MNNTPDQGFCRQPMVRFLRNLSQSRRTSPKRRRRCVANSFGFERLEERQLLTTTFTDAEPNDTWDSAQLLFGDTSYVVNGDTFDLNEDFYAFCAEEGTTIRAARLMDDFPNHVALVRPSFDFEERWGSDNTVYVDSHGSGSATLEATETGLWGLWILLDEDRVGEDGIHFPVQYSISITGAAICSDFQMEEFGWDAIDGVKGMYSLTSAAGMVEPATIGFYWSGDDEWDPADIQATPTFIPTATEPGYYGFELDGRFFTAPDPAHGYLIAYIDVPGPVGAVEESDETNNEAALDLTQVADVSAEVRLSDTSLYLNDLLVATATISNNSPYPVNVEVSRGFASNPKLSVPEPADTATLVLGPGEHVEFADQLSLEWEWIPEEHPLKTEESGSFEYLVKGLFDAVSVVGEFWKPAQVLGALFSVTDVLLALHGTDALYGKQVKEANIDFALLVEPRVRRSEPLEEIASATARVPEDKLRAFDEFVAQVKAFEAELFWLSLAGSTKWGPLAGNVAIGGFRRVAILAGALDAYWRRAYDPPDPEFDHYVVPGFSLPEYLELIPEGPLREREVFLNTVFELEDALFGTADKKDGAFQAANLEWQAEQLIAASNVKHRSVFNGARSLAMEAILLPFLDASLPSPMEVPAILQEDGLAEEVEEMLLLLGWSPESVYQIDATIKETSAEDLHGFGGSTRLAASYLGYFAGAADTFTLLSDAISIRVEKLSYVPRDLTPDEEAILVGYRQQVEEIVASGSPAPTLFSLLERYTAEARRLAIVTSNFRAVAEHLNYAYVVPVDGPVAFANLAGWKSLVVSQSAAGEITSALAGGLTEDAAAIEELIATETWGEADAALHVLIDRVATVPITELSSLAQEKLLPYLQYIREALGQAAVIPAPTIEGLPSEVAVRPGEFVPFAAEAVAVDAALGTFAGGWIDVELIGGTTSDAIELVTDNTIQVTTEQEIVINEVVVGSLSGGSNGAPFRVVFRSGGSPQNVTEVLQHLVVVRSDGMAAPSVVLRLADGVGGVSPDYKIMVLSANAPVVAGDFNGNGFVEQADLDLVLVNWGRDSSPLPTGWVNDHPTGTIDQEELDAVLVNWGATNAAAAGVDGTAAADHLDHAFAHTAPPPPPPVGQIDAAVEARNPSLPRAGMDASAVARRKAAMLARPTAPFWYMENPKERRSAVDAVFTTAGEEDGRAYETLRQELLDLKRPSLAPRL